MPETQPHTDTHTGPNPGPSPASSTGPLTVAQHCAAVAATLTDHLVRRTITAQLHTPLPPHSRLATDIMCPIDLPPFDNSQMDGYAVRHREAAQGPLTITPAIAAGHMPGRLERGTAAPIMTGAAVPAGADLIVPIERCVPAEFDASLTEVSCDTAWVQQATPGTFVRPQASDIAAGAVLLPAGTHLGPAQVGVLANAGISEVELVAPVRVGIISSGDELQAPGAPLAPAHIYDANTLMLSHAVREAGGEVAFTVHVSDDATEFWATVAAAAAPCDVLLTSAGVSKGAFEIIKQVLTGCDFYGVNLQPGGPQGLGVVALPAGVAERTGVARVPVLNFPGNPVSALISFEIFLRPFLREWHGLPSRRAVLHLPLAEPCDSVGKHQVRRAKIITDATAAPVAVALLGGPSSHLLHAYAQADALVHLPVETLHVAAGELVETWILDKVNP